jgi:sulfatase maturation enzyme AslB (radical SAM superfamily)
MFGATEEVWIGKLWPRGRAWANGLSTATLEDNFCNAWSGGLNFLNYGEAGSEVSIDPTGDVYPCCLKTACPLGNLTEEPLISVLDDLAGHPAMQAINAGEPDKMGEFAGWSKEMFIEASKTESPDGRAYQNLCIGCDRFHQQMLGPILDERYRNRRAQRMGILARSATSSTADTNVAC